MIRIRPNILLAVTIPVTALFLYVFISGSLHYDYVDDDLWFMDLLRTKDLPSAYSELYFQVNGRWFSHVLELTVFLLLTKAGLIPLLHLLFAALFFWALSFFLKRMLSVSLDKMVSWRQAWLCSLLLGSVFYFLFPEGRVEVWYWLSSAAVHLSSLTVMLLLLALVTKKERGFPGTTMLGISSLMLGGMSEAYAITLLFLLIVLYWKKRLGQRELMFVLPLLLLSLTFNVLSPGAASRLGQLRDFGLLQALKNTLHSMLLPLLETDRIGIRLLSLLVGFLAGALAARELHIPREELVLKDLMRQSGIVLALIFISLFIPCFLLSDIAAWRMQSFGYLLLLLFVFQLGLKHEGGLSGRRENKKGSG